MLSSLAYLVGIFECRVLTADIADGIKGALDSRKCPSWRRVIRVSVLWDPERHLGSAMKLVAPVLHRVWALVDAKGSSPWRKCRPEGRPSQKQARLDRLSREKPYISSCRPSSCDVSHLPLRSCT